MKTQIIICCFVAIAQSVFTEAINQSPNHPLHRQKRFWGGISAIIGGIKAGAKVVDIANRVLGVDDTAFGRIVNRIAKFDAPEASQMYDAVGEMMHNTTMNMTDKQKERATILRGALQQTMDNPDTTTPAADAGSTVFPGLVSSIMVASFLSAIVLNFTV